MPHMNKKSEKRKNKKRYFQSKKNKPERVLQAGCRGFLITCNNESQCVKESYDILNEFADMQLEPKSLLDDSSSEELEEQIAKEVKVINNDYRFQQMSTKVKGIVFIKTLVDPISLTNSIFENILQTKIRKSRHILKLLPIISTCKASEEDIKKSMNIHLCEYVNVEGNESLTYKIEPKIRHNSNLSSSHLLSYARESFEKNAPSWKVSMLFPDVVVLMTVLKSICCIGFLKNYAKYKKYNLSEMAVDNSISLNTNKSLSDQKMV